MALKEYIISKHSILIEEQLFDYFEEELTSILTFIKLLDYKVYSQWNPAGLYLGVEKIFGVNLILDEENDTTGKLIGYRFYRGDGVLEIAEACWTTGNKKEAILQEGCTYIFDYNDIYLFFEVFKLMINGIPSLTSER